MSSATFIAWALSNLGLVFLVVALIFFMVEWMIHKKVSTYEILYRWMALFAIGGTGIYAFVMHAFMPETAAQAIGWPVSPFQFEVAIADLAMGLLGVLSFNASYGFRLATVISSACCLWGDAVGHLYQIIKFHNYANGNAGSWLFIDLIFPVIMIICIIKIRPKAYTPLFQGS